MTIYSRDENGIGTEGRARKRVADLLRDAWAVQEIEGGWMIRAPMDSFWQRWIRIDKEWAAQAEWKAKAL